MPKAEEALIQAFALHSAGHLPEARNRYQAIVNENPTHFLALHMLGVVAHQMRDAELAVAWIDRALAVNPSDAAAHYNRGLALAELERFSDAVTSYGQAITLNPNYAEAYCSRGTALQAQGRVEEGLSDYRKAKALNPGYFNAWHNEGATLYRLERYEAALTSLERAINLNGDDAEAHNSIGSVLRRLKRPAQALAHYDLALRLQPNDPKIWHNHGTTLLELRRYDAAIASFDRALNLNPALPEALFDRAVALTELGRIEEALTTYGALVQINPDFPYAQGLHLHTRMLCCDWRGIEKEYAEVTAEMHAGKRVLEPFGYQGLCENEVDLKICAEMYAVDQFPVQSSAFELKPPSRRDRIRLGYLSGEFRSQATSVLMTELFELHDRSKFQVFAFDNGWSDQTPLRARLEKAFDGIFNISALSDLDAASLVRQNEIDILVNLNGYFGKGRNGVFAHRASPIQVNYLGFPGTLGAGYMDYLIADDTVIPETSRQHYTEKIVWLPDSYQANDRQRLIAERVFSRAELGLPADGFVFCCFNNTYKITPDTFDIWTRILNRVDNSVLWLLRSNPAAMRNLTQEAARRGIVPSRLVFADKVPLPEHLARHRAADLFLDTLPYNAHTTGSDALWAGLPVLTCVGRTFPGRVAASLLKAIGLPEMITTAPQAYEDLAVALAKDPARLALIRQKLVQNRQTMPLFDTPRFTNHIEDAFLQMHARAKAGLAPAHIRIAP